VPNIFSNASSNLSFLATFGAVLAGILLGAAFEMVGLFAFTNLPEDMGAVPAAEDADSEDFALMVAGFIELASLELDGGVAALLGIGNPIIS
jgi:hypothetical protein